MSCSHLFAPAHQGRPRTCYRAPPRLKPHKPEHAKSISDTPRPATVPGILAARIICTSSRFEPLGEFAPKPSSSSILMAPIRRQRWTAIRLPRRPRVELFRAAGAGLRGRHRFVTRSSSTKIEPSGLPAADRFLHPAALRSPVRPARTARRPAGSKAVHAGRPARRLPRNFVADEFREVVRPRALLFRRQDGGVCGDWQARAGGGTTPTIANQSGQARRPSRLRRRAETHRPGACVVAGSWRARIARPAASRRPAANHFIFFSASALSCVCHLDSGISWWNKGRQPYQ